ncbi:MAG TPA: O-antigen ligase family protein [Bacteroidia bacterium]|nr:O-antigen ligase family protein [Bacteroidia bacterium]
MKTKIDNVRTGFICAAAALLPVNFFAVSMITIVILILTVWIFFREKRKPAPLKLLLPVLIFAFTLIGMIWSAEGSSSIVTVKFSWLIFPIIFFLVPLSGKTETAAVKTSFLGGLLVSTFVCTWWAFTRYHVSRNPADLFYTGFSMFMHPSYYAMYVTAGCIFLWEKIMGNGNGMRMQLVSFVLLLWFGFVLVMLQSKAGIIVSLSLVGIMGLVYSWKTKKMITGAIGLAAFYFLFWAATRYVVTSNNSRIFNAEYNVTHFTAQAEKAPESSQMRILVWQSDWELIRSNFLAGVGSGDVVTELKKVYHRRGITKAEEEGLNAHNQYFQSWLEAGIGAFVALLAALAVPGLTAVRKKDLVLGLFLAAIILNFGVESMLCTQAGTMFTAFFLSFLFSAAETKEELPV